MTATGGQIAWPDITGETWRDDAACAGRDPHLWEPVDHRIDQAARERWAQAVRICASCPVHNECATATTRLDAGSIRGGLLVTQDGRLRVAPPPAPAQQPARRGRALVPCGQVSARKRHHRRKESCPICKTGTYGESLAPCGSKSAKKRHGRRGETCAQCWPETAAA